MRDHIYKNPVKISEHTNDSGSYFGALGFTLQVGLLSLKTVSTASLLAWLTRPTGPHLVEATSDGELRTALAILWTPEALHDPKTSKVGVGLVCKAPYIRSASFSEAYFSLKSASGTEAGQRSSDTSLMFIHITEASQVIPHPTERPLFLDIKHPSFITDSNAPRPPQVFRGFKLHKVHLVKEDTRTTQVAIPHLEGENTHHMITYQKSQIIPEFRMSDTIEAPLDVADEKHWNILKDPVFPACLPGFKDTHETYKGTTSQGGPSTRDMTLATTLSSATGSSSQSAPTSDVNEVREQVHEILAQIFALKVETVQEMGFVRETDRALARALMLEFVRLQLIVGEDLNTSLRAMHAEMEAATSELLRDLDIASRNAMKVPSANPSVRVALDRFNQLVKLKLVLPLTQLDAACEDMERFPRYRLSQLHAQTELRSLLRNLTERMAAHQCRIHQIMQSEARKNTEVSQRVIVGLGADQPIESNFFPGVLEGLLGSLGINAAGGENPPTSSREGVSRMWASAVLEAVRKMEKRDITLEITSGMPQGLHLGYEDDFLQCQPSQMPKVFSDPKFLPSIANSVYDLAIPSTREEAAPFRAAPEKSPSPDEPAGGLGGTSTPKMSLPPSPVGAMDDSNTDSNATVELYQSQSQESSSRSDRVLRKRPRRTSGGSKDGAPSVKKTTVKSEPDQAGGSSPTGLTDEVLRDQRFKVYEKDNEAVFQVRVKILGLGDKTKPSREDIDSSPIFTLRRAADESRAPTILGQHWIPYFEEKGHLLSRRMVALVHQGWCS